MSGRILVSMTWLNSVHSAALATMTVTTAGMSRRRRRCQNPLRSMRPVPSYSESSKRVIR